MTRVERRSPMIRLCYKPVCKKGIVKSIIKMRYYDEIKITFSWPYGGLYQ
jgi:hypothetical protein